MKKQAAQEEKSEAPRLRCNVCFVETPPPSGRRMSDPDQEMVRCGGCGLDCHRICYGCQPSNEAFTCDYCRELASNERPAPAKLCFLCGGNDFLLKRVGENFAHPICLLDSPEVVVRSYRTLEFEMGTQNASKVPLNECVVCKHPSERLHKCSNETCQKRAHLICLVLTNQLMDERGEWTYCFNPNIHIQRMSKEKLKPGAIAEIAKITGANKAQLTVECPDHPSNACVCVDPQSNYPMRNKPPTEEVPWLACDFCKGWYHRHCLKHDDDRVKMKGQYSVFECKYCRDWKACRLKKITQLDPYPKFQLSDVIYIMKESEVRPEHMLSSLVQSLPFMVQDTSKFNKKMEPEKKKQPEPKTANEKKQRAEKASQTSLEKPTDKPVEKTPEKQVEKKQVPVENGKVTPEIAKKKGKAVQPDAERSTPIIEEKVDGPKTLQSGSQDKPKLPEPKIYEPGLQPISKQEVLLPGSAIVPLASVLPTETKPQPALEQKPDPTKMKKKLVNKPDGKSSFKKFSKADEERKEENEVKEEKADTNQINGKANHQKESLNGKRQETIEDFAATVAQLLPRINKDHPKEHEEFIEQEDLIERAKHFLKVKPAVQKQPKKASPLEKLRNLLKKLPNHEKLPRAVQQLISEEAPPKDSPQEIATIQSILRENIRLAKLPETHSQDIFNKTVIEITQLQKTTSFDVMKTLQSESLLRDLARDSPASLNLLDNLRSVYSELLARTLNPQSSEDQSKRDGGNIYHSMLTELSKSQNELGSRERCIEEESRRIEQFLKQNGYLTTEEYSKLYSDSVRMGLVKCLECNGLLETVFYRVLILQNEASQITQQPLKRKLYEQLKRIMASWQSCRIQPTEEFEKECQQYVLQCELLNQIEGQLRTGSDDYSQIVDFALKMYSEQPVLATYLVVDLNQLSNWKVKLQGNMLSLVALLGSIRLEQAKNLIQNCTSLDINRNFLLARYLRLDAYVEFFTEIIREHKKWLDGDFMPIDKWNIDEVLNDLDFVRKHEKDLVRAYEGTFTRRINVQREAAYLQQLQLWFRMSKKAHMVIAFDGKITTHAIKELQRWMTEGRFPRNALLGEVNALASEALKIESQVDKFISRRKKVQEHNEQSLVNRKPSEQQALDLIQQLRRCRFDMQFRIDDLQEELTRFAKKCREVDDVMLSRRLDKVAPMVKFFVDGPVRYERFKELWQIWIELKCLEGNIRSRTELTTLLGVAVEHEDTLRRRYQSTIEAYERYEQLVQASSSAQRSNDCVTIEKLVEMKGYMLREDVREKTTITNWINKFTAACNSYLSGRIFTKEDLERLAINMQTCPIRNERIEADIREQRAIYDRLNVILTRINKSPEPLPEFEIEQCSQHIAELESARLTSELIQSINRNLSNYYQLIQVEQVIDSLSDSSLEFYTGLLNKFAGLIRAFCTKRIDRIRKRLFEQFMPKVMEGPPLDIVTIKNLLKEVVYLMENVEPQQEEAYTAWRKELRKQLGEEAVSRIALEEHEDDEGDEDEEQEEGDYEEDVEEFSDEGMDDEEDYSEREISEQEEMIKEVPMKKKKPNDVVVVEIDDDE